MWVGAEWEQKVFGWKAGKPVVEANGGRVQSTHSSASKPQKTKHDGKPVNCGTKAGNDCWSEGVQGSRAATTSPRQGKLLTGEPDAGAEDRRSQNRPSGSEGGAGSNIPVPTPIDTQSRRSD